MKQKKINASGQAIIEYILAVFIVFSVALGLNHMMSLFSKKLKKGIVCEVAAACPGCPPPTINGLCP